METGKAQHAKQGLCDLSNSTFVRGAWQSLMDTPFSKGLHLVPAFPLQFCRWFGSAQSLRLSTADGAIQSHWQGNHLLHWH